MKLLSIWSHYKLFIVSFAAIGVGGAATFLSAPPAKTVDLAALPSAEPKTTETIVVDVEGAVRQPGVRRLKAGSLVEHALRAAGGFTAEADQVRIRHELNRADELKDHQKIYVPFLGEVTTVSTNAAVSADDALPDALVNINQATLDELDSLPGIGPATAQKIIDYREANGPFAAPEDLLNVSGIGDAKYEKLANLITV